MVRNLRRSSLAALVGLFVLAGCGRSPFELAAADDDSEPNTTEPTPTPAPTEETGPTDTGGETETEDETDGPDFVVTPDVGSDPLTCREILECLLGCLGDLGIECLGACAEGADPTEAAIAGELLTCVVGQCVSEGLCSIDNITGEECIGCLGFGLLLPEPPGCEEQGMACQ